MCIFLALTFACLQLSCHIRAPDCIGFEGWIACVHLFGTDNCWVAAFMLQIALDSNMDGVCEPFGTNNCCLAAFMFQIALGSKDG